MNRRDVQRLVIERALNALAQFGRYNENGTAPGVWNVTGTEIVANLPTLIEMPRLEHIIHARMEGKARPKGKCAEIRVCNKNIIGVHRRLTWRRVAFHIRNFERTRRWDGNRAVCLIRYRGKLILWNGHHRMLVARLLGRTLWGTIFDLDSAESRANYRAWKRSRRNGHSE